MKAAIILLALFFPSIILYAQDQQKLLEHAYKTHSKKELKQFFDNWHKEIPPISDSEFARLNDLQKEAYRVFEAFYHPENLKLLGGLVQNDSFYKSAKYLIIADSIHIYRSENICLSYADTDSVIVHQIMNNHPDGNEFFLRGKDGRLSREILTNYENNFMQEDTELVDFIKYFKPNIDFRDKIPLYLTSDYNAILLHFLGNSFYHL